MQHARTSTRTYICSRAHCCFPSLPAGALVLDLGDEAAADDVVAAIKQMVQTAAAAPAAAGGAANGAAAAPAAAAGAAPARPPAAVKLPPLELRQRALKVRTEECTLCYKKFFFYYCSQLAYYTHPSCGNGRSRCASTAASCCLYQISFHHVSWRCSTWRGDALRDLAYSFLFPDT